MSKNERLIIITLILSLIILPIIYNPLITSGIKIVKIFGYIIYIIELLLPLGIIGTIFYFTNKKKIIENKPQKTFFERLIIKIFAMIITILFIMIINFYILGLLYSLFSYMGVIIDVVILLFGLLPMLYYIYRFFSYKMLGIDSTSSKDSIEKQNNIKTN